MRLDTSGLMCLFDRRDFRHRKAWSLCDGVSTLLMQQRDIREALTTDHDFEQAGF